MITYIKSLFPFRWICIAVLFLMVECILMYAKFPTYYHIGNLITCFVVDITIGLGRSERNPWKNMVGVIYLFTLVGLLITQIV